MVVMHGRLGCARIESLVGLLLPLSQEGGLRRQPVIEIPTMAGAMHFIVKVGALGDFRFRKRSRSGDRQWLELRHLQEVAFDG